MMELNWTLMAFLYLLTGMTTFTCAMLTYIKPITRKIISLFYIRLGIIFMALSFITESFSILFIIVFYSKLAAILIFPAAFFFTIGINYVFKETYISSFLIMVSCLGVLLCYFAFEPNMVLPIYENERLQNYIWIGYFGLIADILTFLIFIMFFYWILLTWMNAPFLVKKEASIMLLSVIIGSISPTIIMLFRVSDNIISNILFSIFISTGILIFSISIIREPKLLYILPFTIYRILVKDKQGFPLFDHDWSESDISEFMFSGFINAVQVMSEEVINAGGLIDINLEKGILILRESKLITVGLVASKSSKLLRQTLLNFSAEFEQQFERELKKSIKDMTVYEPAYLLIDKYFSNFPFKIIPSKKHPLMLSGKYAKIPLGLDNKLKDIFTDEKEYEFIKSELIKSPLCVPEEFMDLYNELKEESYKLSHEDLKDLEYNDK